MRPSRAPRPPLARRLVALAAALPLALVTTVVGTQLAAGPGALDTLVLSSGPAGSGASLTEDLTSVTIAATYSDRAIGPLGSGGAAVRVVATTPVAAASVDASLVSSIGASHWESATLALGTVAGSPVYVLGSPQVQAYVLRAGAPAGSTGTASPGPTGGTGGTGGTGAGSGTGAAGSGGAATGSSPGNASGSVQITITSDRVVVEHREPGSTSSVPPTTAPRPAVQTCVTNPQKPTSPHSSFPLAAYEVPTTGQIRQSSPTLATVTAATGRETIAVFGDEQGLLYAVDAATCQLLPGWPQPLAVPPGQLRPGLPSSERHAVIESTPAVGFPDGPSGPPLIVVGAGSTWNNTGVGEVEAFNLSGQEQWDFPVQGSAKNANGVFSSPAFGPVVPGTGVDVVFGSWDDYLYVLDARGTEVARYANAETIWSSPALYHVPGQPGDDIVVGLDKSQTGRPDGCVGGELADLRYGEVPLGTPGAVGATGIGTTYHGALRSVASRAGLYLVRESPCQGAPAPGQRGQAIWSSPAIGKLGGRLVVAVGTSFYDSPYRSGSDQLYVYPLDPAAPFLWTPLWEGRAPGPVLGSPAIGPLLGGATGASSSGVVDTSFFCPPGQQTRTSCLRTGVSEVAAWVAPTNPASKQLRLLWSRQLPGADSLASPVLVPLTGERTDDVLVGSGGGLLPLAGSTGAFLFGTGTNPPQLAIHSACILFNSPAVADVQGVGHYSGWYADELCSYGGSASPGGGFFAYRLPEPPGSAPAWPMFRGDPTHLGVSWSSLGLPDPGGDPTG